MRHERLRKSCPTLEPRENRRRERARRLQPDDDCGGLTQAQRKQAPQRTGSARQRWARCPRAVRALSVRCGLVNIVELHRTCHGSAMKFPHFPMENIRGNPNMRIWPRVQSAVFSKSRGKKHKPRQNTSQAQARAQARHKPEHKPQVEQLDVE